MAVSSQTATPPCLGMRLVYYNNIKMALDEDAKFDFLFKRPSAIKATQYEVTKYIMILFLHICFLGLYIGCCAVD